LGLGTAAQNVPTVLGNFRGGAGFDVVVMMRSKALRRSSKDFFEFTAEMGFISELQLVGSGFVGVTLSDEVFSEAALEFAEPVAWSTAQMLAEQPLELTFGNGAQRSHLGGIEIGLTRYLFPLLDCQKAPVHMESL
jgi:hypothetical protein